MATALLSLSRPHVRSLSCVRPLIPLRGSLLLAAHAYHRPPTGARQTCTVLTLQYSHVPSLLATPTSSIPHPPARAPLSCETFRREPATRRFVWSFAPMPMSCHRVEHQNGSGRPPAFPRGSASTGIVHRLSGPTTPTRRSPTAPDQLIRLAAAVVSLVRVSIRVRVLGLSPVLSLFTSTQSLFTLPSRYFFAIGLPPVFSLGRLYRPFALHYQAALLPHQLRGHPGLSPAQALLPIRSAPALPHNARGLSTGAHPPSLAATPGIHVCFFSCPY